ncbi:MAG: hypothetical protein ACE5K4_10275, partial [Candidatus Hydrothermarchaeota archaeon]
IEIKDRKVDDIIEELSARGIEIPSSLKNLDPETVLKEFKYHGKNGNVEIKYKLESGEEYKSKSTEGEKIDIEMKYEEKHEEEEKDDNDKEVEEED